MTGKDDDIPDYIPEIAIGPDGEPRIVKEMVVKPSPLPRGMSVFILIMVVATVVYSFVQQGQRNSDLKEQREGDQKIITKVLEGQTSLAETQANLTSTQKDLAAVQRQAARERDRLRNLILAILAARTPEESRRLLEEFVKAEEADPAPSVRASPSPRRTPSPQPSRSPPPHKPPTHPSPSPSPTDTPVADLPPAPVPLPPPVGDCVRIPLIGRVCT